MNKYDKEFPGRPLGDRVVIRRKDDGQDKTRGGLHIPEVAKEKPQEGVVIAVGEGKRNDAGELFPLSVAVNDRVLFGKYSGTEIDIDGESFLVIREDEILLVLT